MFIIPTRRNRISYILFVKKKRKHKQVLGVNYYKWRA